MGKPCGGCPALTPCLQSIPSPQTLQPQPGRQPRPLDHSISLLIALRLPTCLTSVLSPQAAKGPSQSLKKITSFPGSQFFNHFPQLPGKGHTPPTLQPKRTFRSGPASLHPLPTSSSAHFCGASLPSSWLLLTLRVSAKMISPPDAPPTTLSRAATAVPLEQLHDLSVSLSVLGSSLRHAQV